MPAPNESELSGHVPKERRKSMPPNMKMPIIKVTPSSPSPDPNHPDYPEFFEDKLYLAHCGAANRGNVGATEVSTQSVASDVSFDRFRLVLDPQESDDDD